MEWRHSFLRAARPTAATDPAFLNSLEVEDDGEGEGNDEGDCGGHDHEVDGRARRHLVPGNVAPRRLLQRLAGELVRQVVDLRKKDVIMKLNQVVEGTFCVFLYC